MMAFRLLKYLVALTALIASSDPRSASAQQFTGRTTPARTQRTRPVQNARPRAIGVIKAQPVEPELTRPTDSPDTVIAVLPDRWLPPVPTDSAKAITAPVTREYASCLPSANRGRAPPVLQQSL